MGRQIKEFTFILKLEKEPLEGLKPKSHTVRSAFSMVHSGEMLRRWHWKDAVEWLDARTRDEESGMILWLGVYGGRNSPKYSHKVAPSSILAEFLPKSFSECYPLGGIRVGGFLEQGSAPMTAGHHLPDVASCSEDCPHRAITLSPYHVSLSLWAGPWWPGRYRPTLAPCVSLC